MKIRSMTATFGNLEGRTLTLEPGLNVMSAPNEWGKSTWCAFLLAMLYGVDTRQRSRQGTLADKERYKPWSGKPMEGSMDLEWNGRAITIQRRTKGRTPMGEFRAFETDSGLPVPELTAENCGQVLLGVERSVYQRSGFLRGSDLAVTQDEAFSRRLNRLVTTGDDSPAGPALEGKLRELRNKCQYNKSGLIPQARQELQQCRGQLERQQVLEGQIAALKEEQKDLSQEIEALERHRAALEAKENQSKLQKVEEARRMEARARDALAEAEQRCRETLPSEQAREKLRHLDDLRQRREALELEAAMTPRETMPEPPAPFDGMTPRQALEQARVEAENLENLKKKAEKSGKIYLLILGLLGLALSVGGAFALPGQWKWGSVPAALLSLTALFLFGAARHRRKKNRAALENFRAELEESYGGEDPMELAEAYDRACAEAEAGQRARAEDLDSRRQALAREQASLGADRKLLEESVEAWTSWADLCRTVVQAAGYRESLEEMAASLNVEDPGEDSLTLPMEETQSRLRKALEKQTYLRSRMDACLGQSRALPDRTALEAEAERLQSRLTELERYYTAATWALELLSRAQNELQSRFAPRITREASALLSHITGGRYDRLYLDENLSLSAAAPDEATAREIQWRSDGAGDQMYLALRLAVSRALIPDAPLVLDDALTRYDDTRLEEALSLLKQEKRQILLFSCQNRERQLLNQ